MKQILLLLMFSAFAQLGHSQSELFLRFDHRLYGKSFALNQEATSPMGTKYKISRLQFYISGIKITHDGGQELNLNTVYLFVDPSNPNSKEFSLGRFSNVNAVEKIEYAIGVDAASNHLDPASYPANHPLAPKNPTMHWGWTSGYRFISLTGTAARVTGAFVDPVNIEGLGDANFKVKSYSVKSVLENGKIYIDMVAEYNLLLDGISIAGGATNHGESGSAAELVLNGSLKVFSPASPTATNYGIQNKFTEVIYSSTDIFIKYSFPNTAIRMFQLIDLKGNVIQVSRIDSKDGVLPLDKQNIPGNYFYSITQDHHAISTGKITKR